MLLFKSNSPPESSEAALEEEDSEVVVDPTAVLVGVEDSIMELDRPGEEKKKRWEVNAVMKSTAT